MFTGLTKTMHDSRKASRAYRQAVDRSIGLDQVQVRELVDDVLRSRIR